MLQHFISAVLCIIGAFLALDAYAEIKEIKSEPVGGGETLIFDGLKIDMPNWVQATDPSLAKIDGQWWMFFTSINLHDGGKLHTLAATLPAGANLGAEAEQWTIRRNKDEKIIPIISPSADDSAWDGFSIETPRYVRGYDAKQKKWVERIYYTAWPKQGATHWAYTIGFVERQDGAWAKHGSPVVFATEQWEVWDDKPIVGDQAVYYQPGSGPDGADGIWHMWYQANGMEGVSLAYISSKDGVTWENKKRMLPTPPYPNPINITGPYHLDVLARNGQYYFIGWVASSENTDRQGIWVVSSSTPDGSNKGDFTDWIPGVFEKSASWHYTGVHGSQCHSTGLFGATLAQEDGQLWAYYHGVRSNDKNVDSCVDANSNVASIGRVKVSLPVAK